MMSSTHLTRLFGGSPAWVLVRLILLSVIIGLILSAIGLSPAEMFDALISFFQRIWDMGWSAVDWLISYFLIGAVIVFPIWAIFRFFKLRGNGNHR